MNEPGKPHPGSIGTGKRALLAALALALLALLAAAAVLAPDPRGHGTHQQFGLPPCTFYVLFQRPCPACGMTTSWVWLVRGKIGLALAANAGGTLLGCLALAAVPWLLLSAAGGRWLGGVPRSWVSAALAGTIGLVTAGQWFWRLWTS